MTRIGAPTSGATSAVRWNVGFYYGAPGIRSTAAAVLDREYAIPLRMPRNVTVDRIGVTVTVAGGAGSVCRLGIRTDSGFGTPGSLILDAGTVDAATTGDKEIVISQALIGPLVWLTGAHQGGTAASYRAVASSPEGFGDNTIIAAGGSNATVGYQATGISGALPAGYVLASSNSLLMRPYVRCAA